MSKFPLIEQASFSKQAVTTKFSTIYFEIVYGGVHKAAPSRLLETSCLKASSLVNTRSISIVITNEIVFYNL